MDNVQKTCFQKNTAAFLQYRQVLKIWQIISVSEFTTPLQDSDIGSTIGVYGTSIVGTLMAFDATTMSVITSDQFTDGANFTVNGSIYGTLATPVNQTIFIGPYSAPTNPPCRKVWGITQRKPERFWLDFVGRCGLYWVNGLPNTGDYLAWWGSIAPFETGLNDDLNNQFTFSWPPSLKATYYWTYWINPPSITGLDDSTQIIIPEAYHLQYIQCCNAARGMILEGGDFSDDVVEKYLGGWLDTLRAPFKDQKLNPNQTQGPDIGFGPNSGYGNGYGVYGWV